MLGWINLHGLLFGAFRTGGGAGSAALLGSLVDGGRFWAWWGCEFDLWLDLGLESIQYGGCGGARVTTATSGDDVWGDGRHDSVLQEIQRRMEKIKRSVSDVLLMLVDGTDSENFQAITQISVSYDPQCLRTPTVSSQSRDR